MIDIELPSPAALRGGWAALAAVCASQGWLRDVYAEADQWLFHDGGGNWACLRFVEKDKILLVGHDHEYTGTFYGEAASYFEEAETDLLDGAPDCIHVKKIAATALLIFSSAPAFAGASLTGQWRSDRELTMRFIKQNVRLESKDYNFLNQLMGRTCALASISTQDN